MQQMQELGFKTSTPPPRMLSNDRWRTLCVSFRCFWYQGKSNHVNRC
jgi:hypothetical protein